MFRMNDNAIAPYRQHFEHAAKHLPQAHLAARNEALTQWRDQVHSALDEAGLDTEPVDIFFQKDRGHYLGVDTTEAGDRAFDEEFGTHQEGPNPVIRTAAHKALPSAHAAYHARLRHELGL